MFNCFYPFHNFDNNISSTKFVNLERGNRTLKLDDVRIARVFQSFTQLHLN